MINTGTKNDSGCAGHAAIPESESSSAPQELESRSSTDLVAFDMLEQSLGRDSALDILHSFVSFAGESVTELRQAVRAGNFKQARNINRELSNSCKVIGAGQVLRGCILLEEELSEQESGVTDRARIRAATAMVAVETNAVAECLTKLIN